MDKDIPLPDGGVALEIVGLLGKKQRPQLQSTCVLQRDFLGGLITRFCEVCSSSSWEGGRSSKFCESDGRK